MNSGLPSRFVFREYSYYRVAECQSLCQQGRIGNFLTTRAVLHNLFLDEAGRATIMQRLAGSLRVTKNLASHVKDEEAPAESDISIELTARRVDV